MTVYKPFHYLREFPQFFQMVRRDVIQGVVEGHGGNAKIAVTVVLSVQSLVVIPFPVHVKIASPERFHFPESQRDAFGRNDYHLFPYLDFCNKPSL